MVASNIPRLVIAAPHSHSGKTTVTLALLAALTQRGLRVAPFKVGPDYIDPQMHRQAAGRPSYNLDTYLVPAERVRDTFCRVAQNADIAIIEGVMGLFDGSSPTSRVGSTAEVAALLQAPIVLVIDASGMAASVGALIRGFRTYDPDVRVAGVILNRLGSAGHALPGAGHCRRRRRDFGLSPERRRADDRNGISGCCQRLRRIASHHSWGT